MEKGKREPIRGGDRPDGWTGPVQSERSLDEREIRDYLRPGPAPMDAEPAVITLTMAVGAPCNRSDIQWGVSDAVQAPVQSLSLGV